MLRALPVLLLLTALPACGPSLEEVCGQAYAQLVTVGGQPDDDDVRDNFLEACVEAADAARARCLAAARTSDAAMACEATKKRPG